VAYGYGPVDSPCHDSATNIVPIAVIDTRLADQRKHDYKFILCKRCGQIAIMKQTVSRLAT